MISQEAGLLPENSYTNSPVNVFCDWSAKAQKHAENIILEMKIHMDFWFWPNVFHAAAFMGFIPRHTSMEENIMQKLAINVRAFKISVWNQLSTGLGTQSNIW